MHYKELMNDIMTNLLNFLRSRIIFKMGRSYEERSTLYKKN